MHYGRAYLGKMPFPLPPSVPRSVEERFQRHLGPADVNGCVPWIGGESFQIDGSMMRVRRVAFEREHGPIPPGKLVLRRCGHPTCVNPAHLYLGDHYDLNRDLRARRKYKRTRLTEAAVRHIRTSSLLLQDLAKLYSVDQSLISLVRARKRWAWLDDQSPGG